MEEFIHYADNATFDDAGTAEAMQLLLRMYLERRDRRYRAPLNRAIDFVLNSQYPNGGWPQRWPHMRDYPAYARYITFNDDVAQENIRFLLAVYQSLGETRVRRAILPRRRGLPRHPAADAAARLEPPAHARSPPRRRAQL